MTKRNISRGHATAVAPSLWRFRWRWLPGREARADGELMHLCATLFNRHYGRWGPNGHHPGGNVRISPETVAESLKDEDSWLACAYLDDDLVGFCSSLRIVLPGSGIVSWVTRLVVDTSYRQQRIATTLLFGSWQFSDFHAWGLATANPLAVRALETATRRPCRPSVIKKQAPSLLPHLAPRTYIPDHLVVNESGRPAPVVQTDFHLDLSDLRKLRQAAVRDGRPWSLGALEPGQEWFACTFRSQPPATMDDDRLKDLLLGADDIWVQAYENMSLDSTHLWHRHHESEVTWILAHCRPPQGGRVLDVGCGDGRHAGLLARSGFEVTGVDIGERLITRARDDHADSGAQFEIADARQELPDGPFDLALCLYDVLGSSANPEHDRLIVANILRRLRPGGTLIASVMNSGATRNRLHQAQMPGDRQEFLVALEKLPPSRAMETSGDIFDPELLLWHDGVYYRKEQFEGSPTRLPAELIVRDRRYSVGDLRGLLEQAGFEVDMVVPVQAGRWDRRPPLDDADPTAKELLVSARCPTR